jgi:hypothetical protein
MRLTRAETGRPEGDGHRGLGRIVPGCVAKFGRARNKGGIKMYIVR